MEQKGGLPEKRLQQSPPDHHWGPSARSNGTPAQHACLSTGRPPPARSLKPALQRATDSAARCNSPEY